MTRKKGGLLTTELVQVSYTPGVAGSRAVSGNLQRKPTDRVLEGETDQSLTAVLGTLSPSVSVKCNLEFPVLRVNYSCPLSHLNTHTFA